MHPPCRDRRIPRSAPPGKRRARGTPPPRPRSASPACRSTTRKTCRGCRYRSRRAGPSPHPSRPRAPSRAPSPPIRLARSSPTRPAALLGRGRGGRRLVALEKARHRGREPRALPPPEMEPVDREAQRLAALRRLRIVEADALDEALVGGPARIGDHHVEKGPSLGPAARKTNHNHDKRPVEKGVILRELRGGWQGKSGFGLSASPSLLRAQTGRPWKTRQNEQNTYNGRNNFRDPQ